MEEENIELRSEKVRGIIGEIPHAVIRIGISVLFCVMMLLLFICYLIKVPTLVACDVVERQGKKLLITANELNEIPVGSTYELTYNGTVLYTDTIRDIENTTVINHGKIGYRITVNLPDTLNAEGKLIVINDHSSLKATIQTSKMRLLYKYLPFLERK